MTAPIPETFTAALWAANLELPAVSLAAWTAGVEARMAEAQSAGARLLMLPEFACAQWLSFAPADLPITGQVAWLAGLAPEAMAALRPLPARYGVALLAGTMPWAEAGSARRGPAYRNRAWLLLPDGRAFAQDKLCLTPSERNPSGWLLTPGVGMNVIDWDGLRVAIVICLDIEFAALMARLGKLDLDLILVPAKTDMLSGYYRVFGCAKARAIEMQAAVCVVGAIGSPLGHPAYDTVLGGAAAYVPCEAALSPTGVAAALEPHAAASGLSPVLNATLAPGAYRRIRHGGAEAEVWPASWPANRIKIADPAPEEPDPVAR
jgi:predicted amidohydrolase